MEEPCRQEEEGGRPVMKAEHCVVPSLQGLPGAAGGDGEDVVRGIRGRPEGLGDRQLNHEYIYTKSMNVFTSNQ